MKNLFSILFLVLVFEFTTAAAFIDGETKKQVGDLNKKIDRVVDLQKDAQNNQAQQLKILKEQNESINRLNYRLNTLEKKQEVIQKSLTPPPAAEPIIEAPVAAPLPNSAPAIAPTPAATIFVDQPAATIETTAAPIQMAPQPVPTSVEAPSTVPQQPKENRSSAISFFSLFAFIFSGVAMLVMAAIFFRMKKGEEKIQSMLWKSEIDTLRNDFSKGRPSLRIHLGEAGLEIINSGEAIAEEIKVLVGPAPSAMKEKLRTIARMKVGEKVAIDLKSTPGGEPLYATLEYKNPNNGRIYKEQFLLKFDRITGTRIPIQQAS